MSCQVCAICVRMLPLDQVRKSFDRALIADRFSGMGMMTVGDMARRLGIGQCEPALEPVLSGLVQEGRIGRVLVLFIAGREVVFRGADLDRIEASGVIRDPAGGTEIPRDRAKVMIAYEIAPPQSEGLSATIPDLG